MKKNAYSQLKEEILGQAVLDLLLIKKPVTLQALVNQLKIMQINENDPTRLLAFRQALEECESYVSSLQKPHGTFVQAVNVELKHEEQTVQPLASSKGKLH